MTVLQGPLEDPNSKCGRMGLGDALVDHRTSRDDIGGSIKASQTTPLVTPYSRINVLCLAVLDTCNVSTVTQGDQLHEI